jgi:hypothetical protein
VLACPTQVQDLDDRGRETRTCMALANLLEFSGQQPALERAGCMVVVNTHNTHPTLGALGLLNCHRIVYPLAFGWPAFGQAYDNWTLADWCDQCHRKQGLVVWTQTDMQLRGKRYGEALADLILGKVDAVEVEQFGGAEDHRPWSFDWYEMLNCGLRVPLVGGSGKDSNVLPLGCTRTYARLPTDRPRTYQDWIEAVRAGRTFATNSPLLLLTVEDQDPGATVRLSQSRPVRVRAEAHSLVPFERLQVVANGRPVADQAAGGDPAEARLEVEILLPEGGWLAARCWGSTWLPGGSFGGQRVYAHTSPVYVRVGDRPAPTDPASAHRLLAHLDVMRTWVEQEGRFENDAQRERLRRIFEDAINVHRPVSPRPGAQRRGARWGGGPRL